LDIAAEKFGGFREFFVVDAQVGEFEQGIGEIRVGLQSSLKILLCFGLMALAAGDIAEVEQAGRIARIEL